MTDGSNDFPSGVFRAPRDLTPLRAAAEAAKLAWFDLNLEPVANKKAFLAACRKALRFPPSFGMNWDALADCLKDYCADSVVACRGCGSFAEAAPDDYATALEILQEAAMYWQERGSSFLVLLDAEPEGARLARFPARRGS